MYMEKERIKVLKNILYQLLYYLFVFSGRSQPAHTFISQRRTERLCAGQRAKAGGAGKGTVTDLKELRLSKGRQRSKPLPLGLKRCGRKVTSRIWNL